MASNLRSSQRQPCRTPILTFDGLNVIGPEGSGAPAHFHIDAVNLAVAGRKRWFFWLPTTRFWSSMPVLDWFRTKYKKDTKPRPLECVQEPGDIIYVPDLYAHGVLNAEETIAVATEFIGD